MSAEEAGMSNMDMEEEEEEMPTIRLRPKKTEGMWIEKYRPKELGDVISHQNIITTIQQLVSKKKLPHLLFYGPPGTGKTSTMLSIARQIHGSRYQAHTLELNASDDRGIDVVRETIKSFAGTRQMFSSEVKIVILDEADAMTSAAQMALRRVIEKYTKNARFCLICNYVNKIIPALQSRCSRFRFAPLEKADVKAKLLEVAELEKVNMTEEGLQAILQLSKGDMRRCLNILQACHTAYPEVNRRTVHQCTGTPQPETIDAIIKSLFNDTFHDAVHFLRKKQVDEGLALADIVTQVHAVMVRTAMPPDVKMRIFDQLSDLEHRLTVSTDQRIQSTALVSIFAIARAMAFSEEESEEMKDDAS